MWILVVIRDGRATGQLAYRSLGAAAVSYLEDAKGLTPQSVVAATLSSFTVEHIAPPTSSEPRARRWSFSVELALAILLNLAFLVALFYRPTYELQKMMKQPPAISVDLVPPPAQPKPKVEQPRQKPQEEEKQEQQKPEEKKPEEKQKPIVKYRESGGDPKLKPGRAPKVEADKTKVPPEQKVEKPKPEAPKTPAANVPDWAKALDPGYDLPKQADSSITKSRGSNDQNSLSDRIGEGGGDAYLNQLVSQVAAHVRYPPTANGAIGIAEIVIAVDRAGNLKQMSLIRSSGRQDLDWAAAEAVRQSAPFRPLPPDYPTPVVITLKIPVAPGS